MPRMDGLDKNDNIRHSLRSIFFYETTATKLVMENSRSDQRLCPDRIGLVFSRYKYDQNHDRFCSNSVADGPPF